MAGGMKALEIAGVGGAIGSKILTSVAGKALGIAGGVI